jgi:hypothetical protein
MLQSDVRNRGWSGGPFARLGKLWNGMLVNCEVMGCKARVPQQLEEQRRCILHFTLELEQTCMQMRRDTAIGGTRRERYDEMRKYMAEYGQKLAQLATGGVGLTDETKARILSTFLTLMNCRENIERIAARQENERRIG